MHLAARRVYGCLSVLADLLAISWLAWVGPTPPLTLQKRSGGPSPKGQTCSPKRDRVSVHQWEIGDATAGVHRGARRRRGGTSEMGVATEMLSGDRHAVQSLRDEYAQTFHQAQPKRVPS
jgi:hypothetical protein